MPLKTTGIDPASAEHRFGKGTAPGSVAGTEEGSWQTNLVCH